MIVLQSFPAGSVLAATTRARIVLLGALSLNLSRHDVLILRLSEQNLLGPGHNSPSLDVHQLAHQQAHLADIHCGF